MKQRLKNIKYMHDIITKLNNSTVTKYWNVYICNNPTEEYLQEIAEDVDMYDDCVSLFVKLIHHYGLS